MADDFNYDDLDRAINELYNSMENDDSKPRSSRPVKTKSKPSLSEVAPAPQPAARPMAVDVARPAVRTVVHRTAKPVARSARTVSAAPLVGGRPRMMGGDIARPTTKPVATQRRNDGKGMVNVFPLPSRHGRAMDMVVPGKDNHPALAPEPKKTLADIQREHPHQRVIDDVQSSSRAKAIDEDINNLNADIPVATPVNVKRNNYDDVAALAKRTQRTARHPLAQPTPMTPRKRRRTTSAEITDASNTPFLPDAQVEKRPLGSKSKKPHPTYKRDESPSELDDIEPADFDLDDANIEHKETRPKHRLAAGVSKTAKAVKTSRAERRDNKPDDDDDLTDILTSANNVATMVDGSNVEGDLYDEFMNSLDDDSDLSLKKEEQKPKYQRRKKSAKAEHSEMSAHRPRAVNNSAAVRRRNSIISQLILIAIVVIVGFLIGWALHSLDV